MERGRPRDITEHDRKMVAWPMTYTIGEMLAMVEEAAKTDSEAEAWLNGEGYIGLTRNTSRFMYWEEANGAGRLSAEAFGWRDSVFRRDGYTCKDCGQGGQIQAHHILGWASHRDSRYDIDNGVTLCRECHATKHPGRENLIRGARYYGKQRRQT